MAQTSVDQLIATALAHHQAGRLAEAEPLYRQVLAQKPDHPDALYLLGTMATQVGKPEAAVPMLERAIALRPNTAPYHANIGEAYRLVNNFELSLHHLQRAIALDPKLAEAFNNLSLLFRQMNRLDDSISAANQALQIRPNFAEAANNLGIALSDLKRTDDAIAAFNRAIASNPRYAVAYCNLGATLQQAGRAAEALTAVRQAIAIDPQSAESHCNLGNLLKDRGELDAAIKSFQRALGLSPNNAEAHVGLAAALIDSRQFDPAMAACRRAISLKPELANAYNLLANAYAYQGQLEEAIANYQKCVERDPNHAIAFSNLGNALREIGQFEQAIAAFDKAIALDANCGEAFANRALAWLTLGDFKRGFDDYEWRFRHKGPGLNRNFAQPQWDGSDLTGKSILLHAEQGLGDTIQFVRYANLVAQRGGKMIIESQAALGPLMRGFRTDAKLIRRGDPIPPFDVHAPLLSLPRILGTTPATIPADVPYLFAEPERIERWRGELQRYDEFRVGIAWQGNPMHKVDRFRSIPIANYRRLAEVPGVRLISLQKGPASEQARTISGVEIVDLGLKLDAEGAFIDTAAVMKCLDLVITCDTAIAHLAGALGVQTWLVLPAVPDWRWLLDRDDSPWYPTMRLFRQQKLREWDEVFQRLAGELMKRTAHAGSSGERPGSSEYLRPGVNGPIRVETDPGDLIDRITILEVKTARMTDQAKLANVRMQLEKLSATRDASVAPSAELSALADQLREVNGQLWDIEDQIRLCERDQDFGPRFVELARSVYHTNDRRAALKRQINALLSASGGEEKQYASYSREGK